MARLWAQVCIHLGVAMYMPEHTLGVMPWRMGDTAEGERRAPGERRRLTGSRK